MPPRRRFTIQITTCNAIVPDAIAHSTDALTCQYKPSAAKNQSRGKRPRSVADRWRRIGYPASGATTRTAQYGSGDQAHGQMVKNGARSNRRTVIRTNPLSRAGEKLGRCNTRA